MKTNKVGLCSKHFEKLAFYVIHHPNKAYQSINNDDNKKMCIVCKKKATKLVLTPVSKKVLEAIACERKDD